MGQPSSPEIPAIEDRRCAAFRRITSALLEFPRVTVASDLRVTPGDEVLPWLDRPIYGYARAVQDAEPRKRGHPRGPHEDKLPDRESFEPAMWKAWRSLKREPRYHFADPTAPILADRMGLRPKTFYRRRKDLGVAMPKTAPPPLPGFTEA